MVLWATPRTFYQEPLPSERVALQLSEEVIATGKTLWLQGTLGGEHAGSRVLYVELLNQERAVVQGIFPIKNGLARGQLAIPDTLSGGWYQLRAYTQWMRNFGEAAFRTRPLLIVNPTEKTLNLPNQAASASHLPSTTAFPPSSSADGVQIILDKTRYRPRESPSVTLRLLPDTEASSVAVSVRKVSPLAFARPSPAPSDSSTIRLSEPSRYPREDEGLTLSGRVTGMSPSTLDRMVVLSVPGRFPALEYDFADADGSFRIPIEEASSARQPVVLQTSDTSLRVQWTLAEKFAPANTYSLTDFPPVPDSVRQTIRQDYARRAQIMAQYDLFRTRDSTAGPDSAEFRFYGAPNFTVRSDDYIALPTFTEINRELMPGVRLRNNKDGYNLDVFDIPSRTFLEGEPSVFLDGVLIRNLPYLVNFPPDKIELIETVNRRTYYGEYRLDGTVAIYTQSGDAYREALPASAWYGTVRAYTPYRPFDAEDSLPAYQPDFRTLLHWQPAVPLREKPYELLFRNADELGEFEVVVEGVTADGRRIYGRATYVVELF